MHSHPQAIGQCARFLARAAPGAAVVAAPSTADAVRAVAEGGTLAGAAPHAAIGTRHAARLYGAIVLAEAIEDDADNATRFAWIARARRGAGRRGADRRRAAPDAPPLKTALVFWGGGDLAPGWLVGCLGEFSSRAINLTRIESRPRRVGLGHYMFFCDLEGAARTRRSPPRSPDCAAAARRCACSGSFPAAA